MSLSFHINAAWQRRSVRVVPTGEPMIYLCIDLRREGEDEVDLLPSVCECGCALLLCVVPRRYTSVPLKGICCPLSLQF